MKQEWMLHNSHVLEFREPFGAVVCGTSIRLRLEIGSWLQPTAVLLRLWQDGKGETIVPMRLLVRREDSSCYQGDFITEQQPGLVWYYFMIQAGQQSYYYGNNPANQGGVGQLYREVPPSYQITVFKRNAKTPDWFKQSVMYQIFPDRFFNGYEDKRVLHAPRDSVLHAHWDNTPYYIRDVDTKEIVYYDFFGGNLLGIRKKLSYLKSLGINVVYLNPIFRSNSNHRYDTGDYKTVDPMLGSNEEFSALCREAEAYGISFILDGVFSHTGSDSLYFNKYGHYPSVGACQSTASPYYPWYRFTHYPEQYECWWGIDTLPNVEEMEPSYLDFVIEDEDSVIKYWLKQGGKGWRLDVADELPDEFIKRLRTHMKKVNPESVVIGEVWEDASHKSSYGQLREYLWGDELDSVMNYPFRSILLAFILGQKDAQATQAALMSLYENYPRENFYALMNLIGSHDAPRILTLLGEAPAEEKLTVAQQGRFRLSKTQRKLAAARLKLLVAWQMTFPGVPCVYYGDEAGVEGYKDPFNRATFPWGKEDGRLLNWYKQLIAIRQQHAVFKTGSWETLYAVGDVYAYLRRIENGRDVFGAVQEDAVAVVIFNRNSRRNLSVELTFPANLYGVFTNLLSSSENVAIREGKMQFELKPLETKILLRQEERGFSRECGVLLHPTSLPSSHGIGDLGKEAYRFIDFLAAAGQKNWQILPLNPVGYGESPYQCLSAFAGNPLLLSPEEMLAEGWLAAQDMVQDAGFDPDRVDYEKVKKHKETLFQKAFARFRSQSVPEDYDKFVSEHAVWLDDYALFMALKDHFNQAVWNKWDEKIVRREPQSMQHYQSLLATGMTYHRFLQFAFFKQWAALKKYANKRQIYIIGDMPIFVAYDSCDVWANQELFYLNAERRPITVAGVPPDRFSADGQLWGNPHYHWERMAEDDYLWWRGRFRFLARQVDRVRIDHFLGFENYYAIPYGEKTAARGKWVPGPGARFFKTIEKYLGTQPIIAEDLGVITAKVEDLKHAFAFPGMQVLQFSFYRDILAARLPPVISRNSVVYTGTHDNNTSTGWYQQALQDEQDMIQFLLECLGFSYVPVPEEFCWRFIEYAYQSNANTVIIPMQDLLCLDSGARMNLPGSLGGNWQWRCRKSYFTRELANKLAGMVKANNR